MSRRDPRQWRRVSTGGSLWTPAKIANLVAWWRSDTGVGEVGNVVSTWAPIVGGATLTFAASGIAPTYIPSDSNYNGHPSLSLPGPSVSMVSGGSAVLATQPDTVALVGQIGSASPSNLFDGTTQRQIIGSNGTNWYGYAGTELDSTVASASPSIICVVFNATTNIYVNSSAAASATGSASTSNLQEPIIFSEIGNNGTNRCVEILVVTGSMPQATIHQLFQYAGTRYGKAWS